MGEYIWDRVRPGPEAATGAHATRRLEPAISLLPVLVVYTLLSLALTSAPNDEPNYLLYARDLIHHGFAHAYAWGYMWRGPVLPLVLSPMVAIGIPVKVMRILAGPVPLYLTLLVFHQLVRPYVRTARAALLATYALALYLPFLSIVQVIHVEPLAALWLTLSVLLLLRAFRGRRVDAVWAGVTLGLLALTRLEYGYVVLAALAISVVWLLLRRASAMAKQAALATAVALAVCVPWLAYTYSITSKPLYWGDAGGLSLYWMTAQGNLGDWHLGSDTFTKPGLAADRPVFAELNKLQPLQWDARLTHIAVQNIEHHPGHYLGNVVNNIGRLLFNAPYDYENAKTKGLGPPLGMILYALPDGILLGLVAAAVFVAVRARRRLGPEILPIAALAALGFLVHVPVAAYGRFVIPLIPVFAWLVIAVLAPNVRLATEPEPVEG